MSSLRHKTNGRFGVFYVIAAVIITVQIPRKFSLALSEPRLRIIKGKHYQNTRKPRKFSIANDAKTLNCIKPLKTQLPNQMLLL